MLQLLHHTTSLLYTPRKCDICPTYARTSTDKLVTHVALCREKCYSYYTILPHCSTHPESATYVRHMPVHRQTSSSRMSRCVVKSVTVITPYYFTALHTPKVRHMSDICPYIDRQARHACRAVSCKVLQLLHHTTSLLYTPRKCDICPTYARTSTDKLVTHVALCREKCYSYYTILLHCSTHPESATYALTSTDKLVMHVALCREKCYSYYTILLHCSTHPESATYVRHMPVHRQTSSSCMSRCFVKSVTVITPYYFTALHTPKVRHMSDICPYIDRQARHGCRAVS